MKKVITLFLIVILYSSCYAQSKAEKQVEQTVNNLAKAMINADAIALDKIVDDRLSYGHSGGHIEGKKEFIDNIASGKSDFVTMDISKQTIIIHKKTAIVRHHIDCQTNDNHKPGTVSLDVLTVWQKKSGHWKLIARQAVHPSK